MWSVVLPIKSLPLAKTRLGPGLGDVRSQLALAFACDTLVAVAGCKQIDKVYAVTKDPVVARAVSELGAVIVADDEVGGLNEAIQVGERAARRSGMRVAVLTADLPSLRSEEFGEALESAAAVDRRCFVTDAPGTGTTLLTAGPTGRLEPQFGAGSRSAHEESGAVLLPRAGRTLQRDVDTPQDLSEAFDLGVGAFTLAILREHGIGPCSPGRTATMKWATAMRTTSTHTAAACEGAAR